MRRDPGEGVGKGAAAGFARGGGLALYLLAAHALFAGLLVFAFWERPLWILGSEPLLLLSLAAGLALLRRAALAKELMGMAVELLGEGDFASHLLPVGQPEADALVDLFNRMSDRLREERLRLEEQSFLLDKLLAAAPVGMLTLDHDGRVSLLNDAAARLLGLRARSSPAPTPERSTSHRPSDGRARPGSDDLVDGNAPDVGAGGGRPPPVLRVPPSSAGPPLGPHSPICRALSRASLPASPPANRGWCHSRGAAASSATAASSSTAASRAASISSRSSRRSCAPPRRRPTSSSCA